MREPEQRLAFEPIKNPTKRQKPDTNRDRKKYKSSKFSEKKLARGLEIIASGGTLRECAAELDISAKTACDWFIKYAYDDYMKAREIRSLIYVDDMRHYVQDMIAGRMKTEVFREIKDLNKWQASHENSKLFSERKHIDVKVSKITDFLDGIPDE